MQSYPNPTKNLRKIDGKIRFSSKSKQEKSNLVFTTPQKWINIQNYYNKIGSYKNGKFIPQKIEHCITQNNAVNIYQTYFDSLEPAPLVDRSSSRTMFVYKDVESITVSDWEASDDFVVSNLIPISFLETCQSHVMVTRRRFKIGNLLLQSQLSKEHIRFFDLFVHLGNWEPQSAMVHNETEIVFNLRGIQSKGH